MPFDLIENIRHHGFKRLLLAVSGGLDSICLAHYFIENREALGIEWIGIAHVHHGLREGTANRDAKFVEEFAKLHDVPFFLKHLDGDALKAAEGSLEENARDARYKALIEVVKSAGMEMPAQGGHDNNDCGHGKEIAIVTAHHAGDQAETMYMRLKRGTTLAGLRGIQEVRILSNSQGVAGLASEAPLEGVMKDRATGCNQGDTSPTLRFENDCSRMTVEEDDSGRFPLGGGNDKAETNSLPSTSDRLLPTAYCLLPTVSLYRPFLNVSRKELLAYARENGLSWCEDESNTDVKFARNKIRHVFLPNLERECPGTIQQLCKIAGLADKAYAKVMAKCENVFAPCLLNETSLDGAKPQLFGSVMPMQAWSQHSPSELSSALPQDDTSLVSRLSSFVSLDKKKLNKILREYADADLSELFRLWLSELDFRFPMGFFYGSKEPAHVKIPARSVYRKRSIVKIRHTVWICEFKDALSAAKFVSCEMKEKDYNEST